MSEPEWIPPECLPPSLRMQWVPAREDLAEFLDENGRLIVAEGEAHPAEAGGVEVKLLARRGGQHAELAGLHAQNPRARIKRRLQAVWDAWLHLGACLKQVVHEVLHAARIKFRGERNA